MIYLGNSFVGIGDNTLKLEVLNGTSSKPLFLISTKYLIHFKNNFYVKTKNAQHRSVGHFIIISKT